MTNLIRDNKQKLIKLAMKNGINYLAVYGSQARGESKPESDVDLLINFKEPKGLLNLISLEEKFSKILNRNVDLVTKKSLSKHVKPFIQDDLQVIYAKEP